MSELGRREFRQRLARLTDDVLRLGDAWRSLLADAVAVRLDGRIADVAHVLARDDELDVTAEALRSDAVRLIALQSPVAIDLRVLYVVVRVSTMLERVGELGVNVARSVGPTEPGRDDPVSAQIAELAAGADRTLAAAMRHLARRRGDVADLLVLDAHVDRLRTALMATLAEAVALEPERAAWMLRAVLVASWIERASDLGVLIGRQAASITEGWPQDARPG